MWLFRLEYTSITIYSVKLQQSKWLEIISWTAHSAFPVAETDLNRSKSVLKTQPLDLSLDWPLKSLCFNLSADCQHQGTRLIRSLQRLQGYNVSFIKPFFNKTPDIKFITQHVSLRLTLIHRLFTSTKSSQTCRGGAFQTIGTPTWASSGSWAGSAVPAVPPSSRTSWRWHSGSAPPPRPPSGAGSAAPRRRYVSCRSAQSRRWRRRCWRRRLSTSPATRTAASLASAKSERRWERLSVKTRLHRVNVQLSEEVACSYTGRLMDASGVIAWDGWGYFGVFPPLLWVHINMLLLMERKATFTKLKQFEIKQITASMFKTWKSVCTAHALHAVTGEIYLYLTPWVS